MASCQEVITLALRKAAGLGSGEAAAADEAADALVTLQSIYDEWVSTGMFGRAVDVLEDAAYTAEEMDRIFNSTDSAITITLPESIEDDYTGDDRPPKDYSLVRIAGATVQTYIYSAPFGAWQRMTSLVLADTAPLSERSLDGLASVLAARLVEYGPEIKPMVARSAASFLSLLSLKFDAPRVSTQSTYY